MKTFGLKSEHLKIIYDCFEKHLSDKGDLKVWLFGSRVKGNYRPNSDIDITISSRSKKAKASISKIKTDLEESNLPYTVDVVWWGDMAKSFVPEVKKTRIPFWDPSLVEKTTAWRTCPLGQSWVRTHDRPSVGIKDVDGHCRKNPGHKDVIYPDEINSIESKEIFKKAKKPNLFKSKPKWGEEYDSLIAGWTAYWNDILSLNPKLDPNFVKLLIASESSFNPKASPNSSDPKSARGLIQIMPQTRRILSNRKGEIKDHYLDFSHDDLWNPSISIAAGIRWLARKKEIASRKLKREASWYEAILDYKGILKQNPKKGKNPVIRNKIKNLANDLSIKLD